jgi:glycerol kinase
MAQDLILSIDQGTTGTTAMLVDANITTLGTYNVEFPNHYPAPGEVEHSLAEIQTSIQDAVTGLLKKLNISANRIAGIGITNQRETCCFWDKVTGVPIHRALVWQDKRTAETCTALKSAGHEPLFKEKTGLVLDPYFSGTKAAWLLDHVDGARAKAAAGDLLFGTIDTFVTHWFTGAHVTDPSNASRTLLFNIHTLDWDDELLEIINVPRQSLPRIGDSSEIFGYTKNLSFLPDGIPVAGIIGDQQGALFGQAAFSMGMAKCTYGTGAFILVNTGDTPRQSNHGMLTTVGWRIGGKTTYALEGSAFIAGAAVQWLRDGLNIISSAAEIESLAETVPDSGGVIFVPALAGLGAPHWRPDARGLLWGMTGGTTRAHIARAVLDGIALQLTDILDAMAADLGSPLKELRVDGGAARNNLLMQRQADLIQADIKRPQVLETTGLGSALMAGLAVGIWDNLDAVSEKWALDRHFEPNLSPDEVAKTRAKWDTAVQRS